MEPRLDSAGNLARTTGDLMWGNRIGVDIHLGLSEGRAVL